MEKYGEAGSSAIIDDDTLTPNFLLKPNHSNRDLRPEPIVQTASGYMPAKCLAEGAAIDEPSQRTDIPLVINPSQPACS